MYLAGFWYRLGDSDLPSQEATRMNDSGLFMSADGIENGTCNECEKHNQPVLTITERYFGDGAPGFTESAQICERCLSVYVSHAAEVLSHELRAMFSRRSKSVSRT